MIVWPPDFPVWGGPWPLGPPPGYATVYICIIFIVHKGVCFCLYIFIYLFCFAYGGPSGATTTAPSQLLRWWLVCSQVALKTNAEAADLSTSVAGEATIFWCHVLVLLLVSFLSAKEAACVRFASVRIFWLLLDILRTSHCNLLHMSRACQAVFRTLLGQFSRDPCNAFSVRQLSSSH